MKTRIKKIQFGDGTVKYYCEKYNFDWGAFIRMCLIPILGWICLPFIIMYRWQTIKIINKSNDKWILDTTDYGIFTNLDDAKAFIERYKSMMQDKNARETKAKLSLKIIK